VFNECNFGKGNVNEIELDVNERPSEVQKQEESKTEISEDEGKPETLRHLRE